MQTTVYVLFAFLMGIIMSIYLPMNSSVSRYVGSAITANAVFFLIALITAVLIFCIFGEFDSLQRLRQVPFYLFVPGFISAFIVLGTTFVIPHIGARKFFILLIGGQIVTAIVISHFGILESVRDPISIKKAIGASLVVAGAVISTS
jgi:bacterial/archaeal transporter family-2 protein